MRSSNICKEASHLLICLVLFVENAPHVKTQDLEVVIGIQPQQTSEYSVVLSLINEKFVEFLDSLFYNKKSFITIRYQGNGSDHNVTAIETTYDPNQPNNQHYACMVKESMYSFMCIRNNYCSIQNCTLCKNGVGISWFYFGYLSSVYITNKTELCDNGQVIVMYAIAQNDYSTSISIDSSSTTPSELKTVNSTAISTQPTLPGNTSSELNVPVDVPVSVVVVVAVSVVVSVAVCIAIFVFVLVIWRKRKSKKDSNGSQNVIQQNYNHLQNAENVQGTDPSHYTYIAPSLNLYTNYSNYNNEDTKRQEGSVERETSVHTKIVNHKITQSLSADLDSEKLNAYSNDTRDQGRLSPSKCVAFNKDDYYDDVVHN